MAAVARAYTFTDGTDAYGSQIEAEFNTIFNAWNNHNSGTSTWATVSALNATSVPLIADNSSGTNDIVNFKDNGSTVFKVANGGAVTITGGSLIFGTSTAGILGTTTNDSAAAGVVGELLSASASNQSFPTSTQWGDFVSLSITAGDWDVTVIGQAELTGATWSRVDIAFSTTSGNSTTGITGGQNRATMAWTNSSSTPVVVTQSVTYRLSLASTTTTYFKMNATYTAGTPIIGAGTIWARRVR